LWENGISGILGKPPDNRVRDFAESSPSSG
jgi:hypothetical protein